MTALPHLPKPRLSLPQVTLCAIDTRCPALAFESLRMSCHQVRFARAVLFTHGWASPDPLIDTVDIGPIRSSAEYSHFVLRKLVHHIATPFVLVTQWDGFVINANAWSDEFLQYDYIGAPWTYQPKGMEVGNGGFSLRSRRALEAGADPRITHEHPEDQVLCRDFRALCVNDYGVRFAPVAVARQFAVENERRRSPSFGFHGCYHLPRWMPEERLLDWINALPDDFFRSRDGRRFAKALLRARMAHAATMLIERRRAAGRSDPQTRLLGAIARALAALGMTRR